MCCHNLKILKEIVLLNIGLNLVHDLTTNPPTDIWTLRKSLLKRNNVVIYNVKYNITTSHNYCSLNVNLENIA